MNLKSLKFRLTFWYSSAFVLFTALIFVSFFLITRSFLYKETDATLFYHGREAFEVINQQKNDIKTVVTSKNFNTEFDDIPGMVVIILDDQGEIINSSEAIKTDKQTFLSLFNLAKSTNRAVYLNYQFDNLNMRFYLSRISINNKFQGVILLGHPVSDVEKSLSGIISFQLTIFLLSIVPIILGGYILSAQALKPLGNISTKLRKITSENLNEKIENPHTGDEIEELAITFNNLLGRLKSSFYKEHQFIADLAHELKTPLATLKSTIEIILSKKRPTKDYQKTLSEILIDTNRLNSTLKDVLDLAWSESDFHKNLQEKINLSEICLEIKEIATKLSYSQNISVTGHILGKIEIIGKKDKIFRAFLNIVDNAIKFSPSQGKISMNLNKNENHIVFTVTDNGSGIPPKELPHVFTRFYRGSKINITPGSGLGLAIAKSIVKAHRGTINIQSNLGKGTKVSVFLPIIKKPS